MNCVYGSLLQNVCFIDWEEEEKKHSNQICPVPLFYEPISIQSHLIHNQNSVGIAPYTHTQMEQKEMSIGFFEIRQNFYLEMNLNLTFLSYS